MSFKAETPYKATLTDASLAETKDGLPQVQMQFIAENELGEKANFYWHGSLKAGKAQEITIKALLTAGFTSDDIEDLRKEPKPFKAVNNLSITLESYKDKLRVKWVNAGGSVKQYKGAAPKLAGAFAKARQEMGMKSAKQEEVPF